MKASELAFGPFRLDRENALLWRDDQRVSLAPKPFEILAYLAGRPGELVTKDSLLTAVWSGLHVSESSLTVAMNALRVALGDDPSSPRYIETAPKRGYRFIAPVASGRIAEQAAKGPEEMVGGRTGAWVGRSAELETMRRALQGALGGRRQMLFLTGEAGIGKTTLVEMSLSSIRQAGMGVMRCGCNELFGAHEAFLPLTEGLHELCRANDGEALVSALRVRAPTWLAQMPWLLSERDRAGFQREVFGANRERMLREFADFIEGLTAQRPWALILEDMHWSDPATIDVLSRLARGDQPCALLVIASYRRSDAATQQHPIHRIHRELQVKGRSQEVGLDRLTLSEVEQHLALRFQSERIASALVERVFARTEGQPLFVVSLVDDLIARRVIARSDDAWRIADEDASKREDLPSDLREMILRNVANLSTEERTLLDFASAAGPTVSALVLAGALERNVLDVEQECDNLAQRSRILSPVGVAEWPNGEVSGEYAFIHALYREAIYQQLSPARKANIHRRLGASLERGYGARSAEIAPALALHFEVGREFARVIPQLARAAESSARRFSTREAALYLTRALDLLAALPAEAQGQTRLRLLLQRAWTWRASGDFASALNDLGAMVAHARETNNGREEVSGLVNLSRFQLYVDRGQCLPLAELAAERARKIEDKAIGALAEGNLANLRLMLQPWREEDAEICRQAELLIDEAQDLSARLRKCSMEMTLAILSSDYEHCAQATSSGRELAQAVGDVYLYVVYNFTESFANLYAGRWGRVRELATAALAIAERNFNSHASALCRVTLAWLRFEAGEIAGAIADIEPLLTLEAERNPLNAYVCRSILARAHIRVGHLEQARRHLGSVEARIAGGVMIESPVRPHYLLARCEERIAAGDLNQARLEAESLRNSAASAPDRQFLAFALEAQARIAMQEGNGGSVASALGKGLRLVRSGGVPLPERSLYLTAARWLEARGRSASAEALRRRAHRVVRLLAQSLSPEDPLLNAPLFAELSGDAIARRVAGAVAPPQSGNSDMSRGSD